MSEALEFAGSTELKEPNFKCGVKVPAFPGGQDCRVPNMTPEEKLREQGPSAYRPGSGAKGGCTAAVWATAEES